MFALIPFIINHLYHKWCALKIEKHKAYIKGKRELKEDDTAIYQLSYSVDQCKTKVFKTIKHLKFQGG